MRQAVRQYWSRFPPHVILSLAETVVTAVLSAVTLAFANQEETHGMVAGLLFSPFCAPVVMQ